MSIRSIRGGAGGRPRVVRRVHGRDRERRARRFLLNQGMGSSFGYMKSVLWLTTLLLACSSAPSELSSPADVAASANEISASPDRAQKTPEYLAARGSERSGGTARPRDGSYSSIVTGAWSLTSRPPSRRTHARFRRAATGAVPSR